MTAPKKSKIKIEIARGKKKTAVARARIREGKQSLKINGVPVDTIPNTLTRQIITEPLLIGQQVMGEQFATNLDIDVNVTGGGQMGQAFATRTAIGKALIKWTDSEELKNTFSKYDTTLVKEDVRRKEPKKYLRKGARAKPTTSYR